MKIKIQKSRRLRRGRSGRGGQELLFRCRLVGLDRFRRMTRCARFEKIGKITKVDLFWKLKITKVTKAFERDQNL